MAKQIFWISSFPKSGNTLVRAILSSLFFTNDGNFSLDKVRYIKQFEHTTIVNQNKKIFGNDFSKLNNTPIFYKYIKELQTKEALQIKEDFIFLKTHSGLFEIGGNTFTSKENTRGIIYIVRDPRDVCISWSKHLNVSIDKSIDSMTNDLSSSFWVEERGKEIFNDNNRPKSFFSSWEKHVLSWTSTKWDIPIKILKFEDLVYKKKETIEDLINFFKINYKFKFKNIDNKLENIMISTDFQRLKKEEKEKGFIESNSENDFFSVGKKNQWKEKLDKTQVKILEDKFSEVMKKFNYKLSIEI